MRLRQVEIKNFRSIEDATIEFEPRCRILVGMNDTGKSNVLKALSILKEGKIGQESDRRQEVAEEENQDFYIKAIFIPDEHDYEEIKNILMSRVYDPDCNVVDKIITFIRDEKPQRHLIDHLNGKEKEIEIEWSRFYSFKNLKPLLIDYFLENSKEWKKKKTAMPDDIYGVVLKSVRSIRAMPVHRMIERSVTMSIKIKNLIRYDLVKNEDIKSFPDGVRNIFWESVSEEDIFNMISTDVEQWVKRELKIVVWNPGDEKHKITGTIPLEEFTKSPSNFLFMRNIFRLYENPTFSSNDDKEIDDVFITKLNKYKNTNRLIQGYLSDVKKTLNKNFKEIWKHYYCNLEEKRKDINFSFNLNYNNPNLHFEIIEFDKEGKEIFNDIERRSEGFKKITEFLFIVSSEISCKNISNTLFIIDEPETSLHPSAAKDFRDQLIGISEKLENYVVYSTHAISMTDRKNLNRHYITKKENNITSVRSVEEVQREDEQNLSRGIVEHEILFQSIGGSFYEGLKEKNIIFEGWTDKRLFKEYCKGKGFDIESIGFGIAHVFGVTTFNHVTPILELGERDVMIVSDCDEGALDARKIYKQSHSYGRWLTYKDVDKKIHAITAEDFLERNFIIEQVNFCTKDENLIKKDSDFSAEDFRETENKLNLKSIKIWLNKNLHRTDTSKKDNDNLDKIITKIKNQIFNKLQYENILEQEYEKLYKGIENKINNNQTQAPAQDEPTSSSSKKTASGVGETKSISASPPLPSPNASKPTPE